MDQGCGAAAEHICVLEGLDSIPSTDEKFLFGGTAVIAQLVGHLPCIWATQV